MAKLINKLKIKNHLLKELVAEFLGTMIFWTIVISVKSDQLLQPNNQDCESTQLNGLTIPFGIAIGAFIGIASSANISGGHVNPCVSLAMAAAGKIKFAKFLAYSCAQLLGAFCGSSLSYLGHYKSFQSAYNNLCKDDLIHGSSCSIGSVFATFPDKRIDILPLLIDQIVASAFLLIGIMAITDKNNSIPGPLQPPFIATVILGLAQGFTGGPFNPAFELGSRLFLVSYGLGADVLIDQYKQFWYISMVFGPLIGAVIGAWIYIIFIGHHNSLEASNVEKQLKSSEINHRKQDKLKNTTGTVTEGDLESINSKQDEIKNKNLHHISSDEKVVDVSF